MACSKGGSTGEEPDVFQLLKIKAGDITLNSDQMVRNVATDATIIISFSASVDTISAQKRIRIIEDESGKDQKIKMLFKNEFKNVVIKPTSSFSWNSIYTLFIQEGLTSAQGVKFPSVEYNFETRNGEISLLSATVNTQKLSSSKTLRNISYNQVELIFAFSEPLNAQDYQQYFKIYPSYTQQIQLSDDAKSVTITNSEPLDYYRFYSINISEDLKLENGFSFAGLKSSFQTGLDSTRKSPPLSDDELLTKIQQTTFRYFWDFAHPVSGLARERNTSGDVVTTGGSGFGLMAIVTGIERNFVSHSEGLERLSKIVDFLASADRFHGVWPHWLNGSTGDALAFSTYDDGGDLVETAFMAQGLITVRQYLNKNDSGEADLISRINALLDSIEWDWYTRDGQNVLYWHWSPNYGWKMNMPIKGYNEALIVYVLAASSENHGIDPAVYHQGWASSGAIKNGKSFYGYSLPLGFDYGGPLFFAHYSFLGLDPRNLSDRYADYWTQNRNHTLINREHSIVNPNNFVGYSADSWGLTASDEPNGYSVHEPTHDNGTLTPTAAISSIPYTPNKSMDAIHHFYYELGDKLWGEYGFYDAFNPTEGWWANSYLAIDQGPIIIMIENYRSELLWNLFMAAPEVKKALNTLDFTVSQ